MSTALSLPLMTVDKFDRIPDQGRFTYELHFGELVTVGIPAKGLFCLQLRIRDVLETAFGPRQWLVGTGIPYGLSTNTVRLMSAWYAVKDGMPPRTTVFSSVPRTCWSCSRPDPITGPKRVQSRILPTVLRACCW